MSSDSSLFAAVFDATSVKPEVKTSTNTCKFHSQTQLLACLSDAALHKKSGAFTQCDNRMPTLAAKGVMPRSFLRLSLVSLSCIPQFGENMQFN